MWAKTDIDSIFNEETDEEKFYPISANPHLCITCMKCTIRCHPHAVFWKGDTRYVDYNKCQGCLNCVRACPYGAIEVISIKEGTLKGFRINGERCRLCGRCIEPNFCLQNLFELVKDDKGKKRIKFKEGDSSKCMSCLKCFKDCPENAIIPIIE